MAERKPNHICKTCGVEYFACNDCDEKGNWRAVGCCIEHAQAYYKRVMDAREAADSTVITDQNKDELSDN